MIAATGDEIKNALEGIFGVGGANLKGREGTLAKVEIFYRKEDKDPIEWLANFEKAAETNKWATEERKVKVAAAFLKGAASDWYDAKKTDIGAHWITSNNGGNNFVDQFKGYFASDTQKNRWYQELLTL